MELLHAVLAHEVHAFLADECAEVDVQSLASDLHQHADLHRYEVEHPGRVPHVVRQLTEFLHVGTAPHSLKVARLGPERVFHQLCADVRERLERHHHDVLRVIGEEEEIYGRVMQKFPPVADSDLKITVIATTDHTVDLVRTLFADVGILSSTDAQDGGFRSDVEEALHIVQLPEPRNETAVAVNGHNLALTFLQRHHILLELLGLDLVKKALIASLVDLSVKKGRIDLGVPDEERIDHVVDFLTALEAFLVLIDRDELHSGYPAFPRHKVQEQFPVHRGITIESQDPVGFTGALNDRGREFLRHGRCAS